MGFGQAERDGRDYLLIKQDPLRKETLLLAGLRDSRHRRAEIVVISIVVIGRCVVIMVTPVQRFANVWAKPISAMLQHNVRAGAKPGEHHQCGDELTDKFHVPDISASPAGAVKFFGDPGASRAEAQDCIKR
jgi:hypothetical protein